MRYTVQFKHRLVQTKTAEVIADSKEEAIQKAKDSNFEGDEEIVDEQGEETFDYQMVEE